MRPAPAHPRIHPLPVQLRPRPGYALIPELERLSYETSTPMAALAQACALPLEHQIWRVDRLTALQPAEIRIMAVRFGISEEAIWRMTAAYFFPALGSRSATARDPEAARRAVLDALNPFPSQLKLCPACLREGRGVRLAWQTAWSFMCLRHDLMLIDTCPHCQHGLASRRVPDAGVAQAGTCQNQIDGERCPQSFTDLPRVQLESMPEASAAQIAFERALTGHVTPLLGKPQIAQRYLKGLTTLLELLWIVLIPAHFTRSETSVDRTFAEYCSQRHALLTRDGKHEGATDDEIIALPHQPRSPLMVLTAPLAIRLAAASSQHDLSDQLIRLIERSRFWQPESSRWIARHLLRLRDRPDLHWHQAFNETLHWLFKRDPDAREATRYAQPNHHPPQPEHR